MTDYLSQIIAVEKDKKEKATQQFAQASNLLSNRGLLSGISRTYTPKNEEGDELPPESTRVQHTVSSVLSPLQECLTSLFDVIATKDWTNCQARANIVVDGKTLLSSVPATYILFLEKQLAELHAFVKKIPVLDSSEEWRYDENQDCWATPPTETIRSKKIKQTKTAHEGNQHHPPQILVWDEDVPEGKWKTVKFSGAIPASVLNSMLARIEKLQKAVKFAREEANRTPALNQAVGNTILSYLFAS